MRKTFLITTIVLLTAFALQFVFAAVGAFTKPSSDSGYALHSINGMAVIPAVALLTILFAALAKAPGRLIGLSAVPLGLVVLQGILAAMANSFTDEAGGSTTIGLVIGGLHAVNGIIAVHVVVNVMRGARKLTAA